MLEAIAKFSNGAAWLPLVVVLVVLPGLYAILAVDVHKDYAELLKFRIASPDKFRHPSVDVLKRKIDDALYVFELDWWVVVATGVLLVAIASLGELVTISNLVVCKDGESKVAECAKLSSVLRLYCIAVALLLSFRISWARIVAAKHLRMLYASIHS